MNTWGIIIGLTEKIFGTKTPAIPPTCKGEKQMRQVANIHITQDPRTHEFFQCDECKRVYYYHYFPYDGGYTLDPSCQFWGNYNGYENKREWRLISEKNSTKINYQWLPKITKLVIEKKSFVIVL